MWLELLVGAACIVGIVGTVVPILPGTIVCAVAILIWGIVEGGHAWWFTAAALAVLVAGAVLKYLIPGKRMTAQGVPGWVLLAGAAGALVGFFVIPIVGVFVGFALGIYLAEVFRLRSLRMAGPTSVEALKAAGISAVIEMLSAVLATGIWLVGVGAVVLALR